MKKPNQYISSVTANQGRTAPMRVSYMTVFKSTLSSLIIACIFTVYAVGQYGIVTSKGQAKELCKAGCYASGGAVSTACATLVFLASIAGKGNEMGTTYQDCARYGENITNDCLSMCNAQYE